MERDGEPKKKSKLAAKLIIIAWAKTQREKKVRGSQSVRSNRLEQQQQ